MRWLLLLLLAFLIWRIFRWLKNRNIRSSQPPSTNMVCCAVCALHIPEKEAIKQYDPKESRTLYFCSEEHRKQHV